MFLLYDYYGFILVFELIFDLGIMKNYSLGIGYYYF